VNVLADRDQTFIVTEVKGTDIDFGRPFSITATVRNYGSTETVAATVRCAVLQARRYPEAKTVQVPPGGTASVTFTGSSEDPVERGEYTARVSVDDARAVTATATFAVR